jgi:hypothetical protein
MAATRWALHPLAFTLALLGLVAVAAVGGAAGGRGLAVPAGCAAGFANSGST